MIAVLDIAVIFGRCICCLSLPVALTIFSLFFFFFNDTATTEIYTLSLHDALPISLRQLPAFYTAHFSLRQRPAVILPRSCCGSAPSFYTADFSLRQRPAFYTARFSLRQRPSFLYCPFLVAAAPLLFMLTNSWCGRDRKSTRLNSSHPSRSRMPSSA